MFDLQDKVASSVAGVIEPALQAAEAARSAARPTTDLGAYDCYLRALAVFYPMTKEAVLEALGLLEQAIAIDRNYGPALAFAASCHMQFINYSWAEDPATARHKAVDLARRALQVEGDDPGVIASAAMVLAVFGEDIGTMMALADHALALNPSSARGWYHSGFLRLMAGKPDRAIELAEVSLRLSPRARIGGVHTVIGASHFLSRRFDDARGKLLLALEETPNFPVPYRYLAACYAHMGQLAEARDVVTRLRAITPNVIPPRIMYLRSKHRSDDDLAVRLQDRVISEHVVVGRCPKPLDMAPQGRDASKEQTRNINARQSPRHDHVSRTALPRPYQDRRSTRRARPTAYPNYRLARSELRRRRLGCDTFGNSRRAQ